MTSPEATLASAAREVTLYLAFVSPRSSSLALAGPVPSPPSIPLRTRSGSVAATPGSRDRAHGLLEHLHDERPHVDRRAGAFAVGGRIRRQRGLEVAEDSAWTSSRTAPGLTTRTHWRTILRSLSCPELERPVCADHGVSNARQTSSARHPDATEHCHGDSTSGAGARSAETPAGAVAAASQPLAAVPPGPGRRADTRTGDARSTTCCRLGAGPARPLGPGRERTPNSAHVGVCRHERDRAGGRLCLRSLTSHRRDRQ